MYIGQEITNKLIGDKEMIDVVLEKKINLRDAMSAFGLDDVEVTLDEYVNDMAAPMEDIKVYDKIARMLGTSDLSDIKILTMDSVSDTDTFSAIFDEIATYPCKDIGDYSVVDSDGMRVAYSYQEGGYPIIMVRM